MAHFDTIISKTPELLNNFKGYEGNPPTNAEEYAALDCWKDGFTPPAWVEFENAIVIANIQNQRSQSYPKITDQLDMLYHDIKNGTLDSGAWIQAIEAVKTQYPKP